MLSSAPTLVRSITSKSDSDAFIGHDDDPDYKNLTRFAHLLKHEVLPKACTSITDLVRAIHIVAYNSGLVDETNTDYIVTPLNSLNISVLNALFQDRVNEKIIEYFNDLSVPLEQKLADLIDTYQDSYTDCVYLPSRIIISDLHGDETSTSSRTITMKFMFRSYAKIVMEFLEFCPDIVEYEVLPHCQDARLCYAYIRHLVVKRDFRRCAAFIQNNQDLIKRGSHYMYCDVIEFDNTHRAIDRMFNRIRDIIQDTHEPLSKETCMEILDQYCEIIRI